MQSLQRVQVQYIYKQGMLVDFHTTMHAYVISVKQEAA